MAPSSEYFSYTLPFTKSARPFSTPLISETASSMRSLHELQCIPFTLIVLSIFLHPAPFRGTRHAVEGKNQEKDAQRADIIAYIGEECTCRAEAEPDEPYGLAHGAGR